MFVNSRRQLSLLCVIALVVALFLPVTVVAEEESYETVFDETEITGDDRSNFLWAKRL